MMTITTASNPHQRRGILAEGRSLPMLTVRSFLIIGHVALFVVKSMGEIWMKAAKFFWDGVIHFEFGTAALVPVEGNQERCEQLGGAEPFVWSRLRNHGRTSFVLGGLPSHRPF